MDTKLTEGELTLLSLIYPMTREKMTAAQKTAFAEAAVIQNEFIEKNGNPAVKSESVGDVSVTYGYSSAEYGITDGGAAVSPAAYAKLKAAGLLLSWI